MTFARFLLAGGVCVVTLTVGCITKNDARSNVFGGQGAVVASPKEMPLPSEDSESKSYGACSGPAPASEVALLDDFEDKDNKPFRAFHREGWWFAASDKTQGSKISPMGTFEAEALPSGEASKDNAFAAHFSAQGQTDWGVSLGTSLNWVKDGVRCPLNAGAFSGFKFRAKGPGTVAVTFNLPETVPQESGGVCTRGCYDTHRQVIFLTDRWEEYVIRFDRLQQAGWGTEARFDPKRIIGVNFVVGVKELPADFWLDDLEFIPAAKTAAR